MLPRTDIKPTELLPNRCICTVMLQRLFEWRREVEKGAQVSGSRAVVNVFLFFFDCYVTSRHVTQKNPTISSWTFDPAKKHRSWGSFMLTARSYAPHQKPVCTLLHSGYHHDFQVFCVHIIPFWSARIVIVKVPRCWHHFRPPHLCCYVAATARATTAPSNLCCEPYCFADGLLHVNCIAFGRAAILLGWKEPEIDGGVHCVNRIPHPRQAVIVDSTLRIAGSVVTVSRKAAIKRMLFAVLLERWRVSSSSRKIITWVAFF